LRPSSTPRLIYSAITSLNGYVTDRDGPMGRSRFSRDLHLKLELLDERRFRSGVVHLHYRGL